MTKAAGLSLISAIIWEWVRGWVHLGVNCLEAEFFKGWLILGMNFSRDELS